MAEIRFHLDEHIEYSIALGLRLRGVDVSTTVEAELLGASDEVQLGHALAQGRMLVTRDDDFLGLAARGIPHAGIVMAPEGRQRIGRTVLGLVNLLRFRTAEDVVNQVVYL